MKTLCARSRSQQTVCKLLLFFVGFFYWLSFHAVLASDNSASLLEEYTPVTLDDLADPPAEDWLMWRGTANHWAHSALDQINQDNVANLRLAWAWTLEPGKQETTPLVHDGVMFLPQA